MEKLLLVIILIFTCVWGYTQDSLKNDTHSRARNNMLVGMLGDGSYISFQYERIIPKGRRSLISAQLGIGVNQEFQINLPCFFGPCPPDLAPEQYILINYGVSGNFGNKRNFFELGIGGAHAFGVLYGSTTNIPYIKSGYRFQPLLKRQFTFRVQVFYPIEGYKSIDGFIFFPIGASIGMTL